MQVDNTLIGGLNLDSNPIAVTSDQLTNCLNGTIKTFNGNENVLQNDMGNCQITHAYLPDGYVPVGMTEYGGIVYVASKNPFTNECQLGSFPSPKQLEDATNGANASTIEIEDFLDENDKTVKNTQVLKKLSIDSLRAGDSFYIKEADSTPVEAEIEYPNDFQYDDNNKDYTDFKVSVGIKGSNNSITKINTIYAEKNFIDNPGELYLIGELNIPNNFGIKHSFNSSGLKIESDTAFNINIKTEDTTINSDITSSENNKYVFSTTGIKSDFVKYEVTPLKQYNNVYYKIPQLALQDTLYKETQYSIIPNLNVWRYTYDTVNNVVNLVYGFTGAQSVQQVIFKFYNYVDGNFNTDNPVSKTEQGKSHFNGQFKVNIGNLTPNQLYLVEIKAGTETFYKWLWTNDLLNKNQNDFENQPVKLNVISDVKYEFERGDITKEYYEGNVQVQEPTSSKSDNNDFIWSIKSVQKFNLNSKSNNANVIDSDKIPYIINIDLSPSFTIDISNNVNEQEIYNKNRTISKNLEYSVSAGQNYITMTTEYGFIGSAKQITETPANSYVLEKYYDGGNEQIVCNSVTLGMVMGYYKVWIGKDVWVTCYGLSNSDGLINDCVYTNLLRAEHKNNLVHRSWGYQIMPRLKTWIYKRMGYYPTIIFLTPSNYLFDKIKTDFDFDVDPKPFNGILDINGTDTKSNYALVLWYDGDNYCILKDVFEDVDNKDGVCGAKQAVKTLLDTLYISSSEHKQTNVVDGVCIPNKNEYAFTTDNKITCKVITNINVAIETNNLGQFTDSIKLAVDTFFNHKKTTGNFTPANKINALKDSANITFELDLLNNSQTVEYTLTSKTVDISQEVSTFLNGNNEYGILNYNGSTVDSNGNPLELNRIYKLNSENIPTPVDTDVFRITKIDGKNRIVLKKGVILTDPINVGDSGIHAYIRPIIGDDEYPFSFVYGWNEDRGVFDCNYEYLADYSIKKETTKLFGK